MLVLHLVRFGLSLVQSFLAVSHSFLTEWVCLFCVIVYGESCLDCFFSFPGVSSLEFITLSLSRDSGLLNHVTILKIMWTPKVRVNTFYSTGWPETY